MKSENLLGLILSALLGVGVLHALYHRPQPAPVPAKDAAQPQSPVAAKRTLLYFGASWCLPCRKMQATLRDPEVTAAMTGTVVTTYDVDRDRDTARKHSVSAVPTYILLDTDGRELRRSSGYKSPADFAAWLKGESPPQPSPQPSPGPGPMP